MALRERASTAADMGGSIADAANTSPSSTVTSKTRPSGSSASSIRSLRNRTSFFGRSNSDAGRKRKPHVHSATSSQDSTDEQAQSRPHTALSPDRASFRSRTPTLDSLRNSVFGGRRNAPTTPNRDRADSSTLPAPMTIPAAIASAIPTWTREHFTSKEDYDRHLTKQTISPPFNFMHVTHTAKTQLPALDTVTERDLPGEFWSKNAYQRPRRHLHGIKADNLRKNRRPSESTPASPISSKSRPISPIAEGELDDPPVSLERLRYVSPLDETIFDEISQTCFDPDEVALSLQPANQVLRYPKRYSSMNAIDKIADGNATGSEMTAFFENDPSLEDKSAKTPTLAPSIEIDSPDVIPEDTCDNNESGPQKPLPALPEKQPSKNQFKESRKARSTSNASAKTPQPVSPRSKRSSRSLRNTLMSPAFSSHSDVRTSMSFSDIASWEDDVDFCYEQEAESTCDFNWDIISRARGDSTQTLETGLSMSSYHAYSPAVSIDSGSSLRFHDRNGSTETIAERRRSRAASSHHKRGSSAASVGHRGFLAARKSSGDLTGMTQPHPTPLQISPNPAQVNVLSPVFSVTGADDEQPKSPFTPEALHYPRFDSIISENLSDPESCRNSGSSKHRKSSSYGSHESNARSLPNAAKETNRWSVASVSSLPDLLHSRSKSRISKLIISSPLEALPQSPPSEDDPPNPNNRESCILPLQMHDQSHRNSYVLRQPEASGERDVMQAAGRVVQRRGARSQSQHRMSTIIQTPDGLAVPEASKTGPQWI